MTEKITRVRKKKEFVNPEITEQITSLDQMYRWIAMDVLKHENKIELLSHSVIILFIFMFMRTVYLLCS
jgi:hypothetical protein